MTGSRLNHLHSRCDAAFRLVVTMLCHAKAQNSPPGICHAVLSQPDYVPNEVGQLPLPDAVVVIRGDRLVRPAKAQQVDSKHSVPCLHQCWYVVSPMIRGRAKAVHQQNGGLFTAAFRSCKGRAAPHGVWMCQRGAHAGARTVVAVRRCELCRRRCSQSSRDQTCADVVNAVGPRHAVLPVPKLPPPRPVPEALQVTRSSLELQALRQAPTQQVHMSASRLYSRGALDAVAAASRIRTQLLFQRTGMCGDGATTAAPACALQWLMRRSLLLLVSPVAQLSLVSGCTRVPELHCLRHLVRLPAWHPPMPASAVIMPGKVAGRI